MVPVRITVFSSAIVIVVIVHCHTAGALLSQSAENKRPYHRVSAPTGSGSSTRRYPTISPATLTCAREVS